MDITSDNTSVDEGQAHQFIIFIMFTEDTIMRCLHFKLEGGKMC